MCFEPPRQIKVDLYWQQSRQMLHVRFMGAAFSLVTSGWFISLILLKLASGKCWMCLLLFCCLFISMSLCWLYSVWFCPFWNTEGIIFHSFLSVVKCRVYYMCLHSSFNCTLKLKTIINNCLSRRKWKLIVLILTKKKKPHSIVLNIMISDNNKSWIACLHMVFPEAREHRQQRTSLRTTDLWVVFPRLTKESWLPSSIWQCHWLKEHGWHVKVERHPTGCHAACVFGELRPAALHHKSC